MKVVLVTNFEQSAFDAKAVQAMAAVGDLVTFNEPFSWNQVTASLDDEDEKILAVDARFCGWSVPDGIINGMRGLKAVCLQTTSFDWIDAANWGIPVTNVRGFSTNAVAEWATMVVLMLARRLPLVMVATGRPYSERQPGIELSGKTAGVIGLGRIGSAIASAMRALRMNVQYWSRSPISAEFPNVSLEKLFSSSDVIFPALSRNAQTSTIITNELLSSIKSTAIFVSVIPRVYNHALLLDFAARSEIGGYGFERTSSDIEVSYAGNVWAASELAWYTEEARLRNATLWAECIIEAARGGFPNRIN